MHQPSKAVGEQPRIAIIGAGFGGLGMAIRLKLAGYTDITVYEKADTLGGTWRENTYPGACCDIRAFNYCYSFEQKTDWSAHWVPWDEILEYMNHCADKYAVRSHIRFSTPIVRARYDEADAVWTLETGSGEKIDVDFLISSTGQLNLPFIPEIAGADTFRGRLFHSAAWDHDFDYAGKRIAVIGNAASAIQFIPRLARSAAEVNVFQRSANWIIQRGNRPFSARAKRLLGRSKVLSKLYRFAIWLQYEGIFYPVIRGIPGFTHYGRWLTKRALAEVENPALRAKLTPDYPIGAKRVLMSDSYYHALNRENVNVVDSGIERITERGLVTCDGREVPADAIVYGTGFRSTEFLAPMEINGRAGVSLREHWRQTGSEAYLGLMVPGFPNFFTIYGPGSNLGHYSIIFMFERQFHYILESLKLVRQTGSSSIEVTADACARFNRRLQEQLAGSAWAKLDKSWYISGGKIVNNWGWSTAWYWWRTRKVDRDHVALKPRQHPTPARRPERADAGTAAIPG